MRRTCSTDYVQANFAQLEDEVAELKAHVANLAVAVQQIQIEDVVDNSGPLRKVKP